MDNPNEQNDAKTTERASRLKKALAFSIKPLAVLICAVYVAAGVFGLFRPSGRWHGFFESRAPAQAARVRVNSSTTGACTITVAGAI